MSNREVSSDRRMDTLRMLQAEVKEVREALVEHRVRLDNGTHVFANERSEREKLARRLDGVIEATAPKPVSVTKVISITLALVMAAAGALWGLSNKLRDRPTEQQIEKLMHSHDGVGHPQMRKDITAIKVQQDKLKDAVVNEDGSSKIDKLLDRIPEPEPKKKPPRRRRR